MHEFDLRGRHDTSISDLLPSEIEDSATAIRLAGAPEDLVRQVFTPDNRDIIPGEDSIPNFWDTPWYDLARKLRTIVPRVYDLADYNLRFDKYPDGYNGHGMVHIVEVARNTDLLLEKAGADSSLRRIGVVASYAHDAGNIIRRKGHSLHSSGVFERVVPSVKQNPGVWAATRRIIELHDESTIIPEIRSWNAESIEEEIRILREEFGPVLQALIIADKTDIGRHRANEWARSPEAIERDTHAFVNFFGEHRNYEVADNTFLWNVEYHPGLTDEEREKFGEMQRKRSAHEGYAAYVPKWLHQLHKEGRVSHCDGWKHAFMKIYRQRINLSAKCVFALFPDIQEFSVVMHDPVVANDLSSGGRKFIETINRERFGQYLVMQDVIYTPKIEKNNQRNGS